MVLQMSVLQLIAGEAQGLPTYRSYIYMWISGEEQFIHTYRSQIVEIRGGTVYSYIQVTNKKISGEEQFMHTYYIQVTNSRYQGRNSLCIHTGHK